MSRELGSRQSTRAEVKGKGQARGGGMKKFLKTSRLCGYQGLLETVKTLSDSRRGEWKEGEMTVDRKVGELQSRQRRLSLGVRGGPWMVTSKATEHHRRSSSLLLPLPQLRATPAHLPPLPHHDGLCPLN